MSPPWQGEHPWLQPTRVSAFLAWWGLQGLLAGAGERGVIACGACIGCVWGCVCLNVSTNYISNCTSVYARS